MDLAVLLTAGAVIALIMMSFLFSGSETAMTAVSRAKLHSLEKQGDERAGLVARLIARKDRLIGALLIGNNLVNILASALTTSLFLQLFGEAGVVYATLIMTVVVVIFAEILPKSWALSKPERFALAVAPLVNIITLLFGRLSFYANALVQKLLKAFGIHLGQDDDIYAAREELRGAVEVLHQDGSFVKDERDRLGGLLDLSELEVSDVMVHRTHMRSVNRDETPAAIVKQILESPYTRMPVWKDEPENIVGLVHAKDLLRALSAADNDPKKVNIDSVAMKPWFVPDTTRLQDQLNAFLRRKEHFALVVDEYGDMEGLVTLEDILEEIVGEIADEHDVVVTGVTTDADGSVVVDGTVPIRDLNRALDWELPDEEANTIAGLLIHEAQSIPEEKQAFTFYGKRFIVLKRERNRIAKLRVRPV